MTSSRRFCISAYHLQERISVGGPASWSSPISSRKWGDANGDLYLCDAIVDDHDDPSASRSASAPKSSLDIWSVPANSNAPINNCCKTYELCGFNSGDDGRRCALCETPIWTIYLAARNYRRWRATLVSVIDFGTGTHFQFGRDPILYAPREMRFPLYAGLISMWVWLSFWRGYSAYIGAGARRCLARVCYRRMGAGIIDVPSLASTRMAPYAIATRAKLETNS